MESISSPQDPLRESSRAKREQRQERNREHHRDSRGSGSRRRSDRETSVPHDEQYAISTKHTRPQQQQQPPVSNNRGSNRSRERPREPHRPLSQHEQPPPQLGTTTDMMENLEPCKLT